MKRTKASKKPVARRASVKARSKVERIPSTSESARDEGPRLIPLDQRLKEPSRLEHYLDLADTALGLRREEKK